jgi:hypothetical protein
MKPATTVVGVALAAILRLVGVESPLIGAKAPSYNPIAKFVACLWERVYPRMVRQITVTPPNGCNSRNPTTAYRG